MFEKIDLLKEQLDKSSPLSKIVEDKLKNAFNIDMIYNSNAIEGNRLDGDPHSIKFYFLRLPQGDLKK